MIAIAAQIFNRYLRIRKRSLDQRFYFMGLHRHSDISFANILSLMIAVGI
jgi:hypothetical protein